MSFEGAQDPADFSLAEATNRVAAGVWANIQHRKWTLVWAVLLGGGIGGSGWVGPFVGFAIIAVSLLAGARGASWRISGALILGISAIVSILMLLTRVSVQPSTLITQSVVLLGFGAFAYWVLVNGPSDWSKPLYAQSRRLRDRAGHWCSTSRVVGRPGRSLDGTDLDQGNVEIGQVGEQRTASLLMQLLDIPSVRIFHSVRWPGARADIDHVVVIGRLVVPVDSKVWRGGTYSLELGNLYRDGQPFRGGSVKMVEAMQSLRRHLVGTPAIVPYAVVAIHADDRPVIIHPTLEAELERSGLAVMAATDLIPFLRNLSDDFARELSPTVLDAVLGLV